VKLWTASFPEIHHDNDQGTVRCKLKQAIAIVKSSCTKRGSCITMVGSLNFHSSSAIVIIYKIL
jgi:hypothetical protein